jgi:hypothetical protein
MTRRATAVFCACVLATGLCAPIRPAAAAAGCAGSPLAGRPRSLEPHFPESRFAEPHFPERRVAEPRSPEPRSPAPGDVATVGAELARRLRGVTPPARLRVPTWVHVITDGVSRAPNSAVRAQLATLNAAYGGRFGGVDTGVRFRLDGISVTRNARWFTDPITHEHAMKSALRRGGAETLNLYLAQLGDLVLGFAAYPYWYEDEPALDGVVVDWRGLPGGSQPGYDRGFTGVHEIGHWLGLFHTFENGCQEPGDGIPDTPPQVRPTNGCPATQDSCPQPGQDGVHNFMDYARDRCMREFTPGQAERMRQMWAAYRGRAATKISR